MFWGYFLSLSWNQMFVLRMYYERSHSVVGISEIPSPRHTYAAPSLFAFTWKLKQISVIIQQIHFTLSELWTIPWQHWRTAPVLGFWWFLGSTHVFKSRLKLRTHQWFCCRWNLKYIQDIHFDSFKKRATAKLF